MGTTAPATPALAVAGVVGTVLLGAMGLTQKVLLFGCLPLGAWGMVRLVRPFGSQRASLVAGVAYLALPLPYDALALGRLGALAAYAGSPWVLGHLFRSTDMPPYGAGGRAMVRAGGAGGGGEAAGGGAAGGGGGGAGGVATPDGGEVTGAAGRRARTATPPGFSVPAGVVVTPADSPPSRVERRNRGRGRAGAISSGRVAPGRRWLAGHRTLRACVLLGVLEAVLVAFVPAAAVVVVVTGLAVAVASWCSASGPGRCGRCGSPSGRRWWRASSASRG